MTITYSNMPLNRGTHQRKSLVWLKAQFNHVNAQFCVINDGKSYFKQGEGVIPYFLSKDVLSPITVKHCIYLGETASGVFFAVDYNKLRFSTQQALNDDGVWLSLRQATPLLSHSEAAILALAKGIVHWHLTHLYCGLCGSINRAEEAGHARKCSECRNRTFPRTDPAVIMLIERMFDDGIPRCLLGRQASWSQGVYSTLAGFVDPGETLEEAVIREVREETMVNVENPQYVASQPWPFPASIMLGFTAVATSEHIDVRQDDLEQAHWFSREQLQAFADNKDDTEGMGYKMSRGDSISAYLINAWKDKKIGQY